MEGVWLGQASEGRNDCEGVFSLDQIKVHIPIGDLGDFASCYHCGKMEEEWDRSGS